MQWNFKWTMLVLVGLAVVLSACQTEASEEMLETNASEEGVMSPTDPGGEVGFVEIAIPEAFRSEYEEGENQVWPITEEEGGEICGWVMITFPAPEDDGGLVMVEVSTDYLEAVGLGPDFWVDLDQDEYRDVEPDIIENCRGTTEPKTHERRLCHVNNIIRVVRALTP